MRRSEWAGAGTGLATAVDAQSSRCLDTYRADPRRVESDSLIEISAAEGGYGRKQLNELVQNAADALNGTRGRVAAVRTDDCLYVANMGAPFSEAGVHAVMASHLSQKRGDEIGRFGLGFKSVTAVTDRPQIFSTSGSFGFDRSSNVARIRGVVPTASRFPLLRLAVPLDPVEQAEHDPLLADLMSWATTVVRLPLKAGVGGQIGDFEAFSPEFLLFSPQVSELLLEDQVLGVSRMIRAVPARAGLVSLQEGERTEDWRVLRRAHRPSTTAVRDAGEIALREVVDVQWALPDVPTGRLGTFWAYFPIDGAKTTLSGLVNAPWKMSDDRLTILDGAFNREILTDVLPSMFIEALPALVRAEDPVSYLDVLPARGRESRSWADGQINDPVFERLSRVPSLPDLTGELRVPGTLKIPPKALTDNVRWGDLWEAACPQPARWAHREVNKTLERRLKAIRLVHGRPSAPSSRDDGSTLVDALEALCTVPTVSQSAAALTLIAEMCQEDPAQQATLAAAKVLLLENGQLVAPLRGRVFVRDGAVDDHEVEYIDARLLDVPGVEDALALLGIQVLDGAGELRHALLKAVLTRESDWREIWELARSVSLDVADGIFKECVPAPRESLVHVRTHANTWRPLSLTLLGGAVIPPNGQRDSGFLIDPDFHAADVDLISRLGGGAQPAYRAAAPVESWFHSYRSEVIDRFIAGASGSRPATDRVLVEGRPMPPWPLALLSRLSPESRVEMTRTAITLDPGREWSVRHMSNKSYGRLDVPSPTVWWVKENGYLDTPLGPWPVSDCLVPADDVMTDVLPVPDVGEEVSRRLGMAERPANLSVETWQDMLAAAQTWTDVRRAARLYSWAAYFVPAPDLVRAQIGTLPGLVATADVAVTSDEEVHKSLSDQHLPCLFVEEESDAQRLIDSWGLSVGRRLLERELVVERLGEPVRLTDAFPGLRLWLPSDLSGIELQHCGSIEVVSPTPRGQVSRPSRGLLHEGQVLITAGDAASMLEQVAAALKLDLSSADVRSILDKQDERRTQELRAQSRAAADDDSRLALLVGVDALRRSVPTSAIRDTERELGRQLGATELAAMARAVHGTGVLQAFKTALEARGLNPPGAWAGLSPARKFVASLGFPTDYAGTPSQQRPAVFEVAGPSPLGPLHDYQSTVTRRIRELIGGHGPARGMVSLPTGAGKTRVAVQALIEAVADGGLQGPIMWIAQSDELCEQAVQTWAHVWRSLGPGTVLTISRFWGSNDVVEDPTAFQLIVATPDKLRNAVDQPSREWMTEASVVVVDEAHTSVAATYSSVLNWLGRGRSRAARRPLLGLTATPFRNTNEDETRRLVNRYDDNRLDSGAFEGDPYAELQDRGVLARVRQQVLDGVEVELTAKDLEQINTFGVLPKSVEGRLGDDGERNRRIIDSVAGLPDDWTVLLFATSVQNAKSLAARLTVRGISSVTISADTDSSSRRRSIEAFKAGDIRVITNYNVLAQGFDAPAVRAVYVTRPTFSTNLYQQMIGRGLRGPVNGGSDEVLIVNVRDNLHQFGERLAFYDFEHLWNGG